MYRRSPDGMLLLCLDRLCRSVMREVHAGVCGPHMGGHMLARKIMRTVGGGRSYARLTSAGVASFIRSHIICRYGVPHELISDRGVHFRAEVDTLVQRYSIRHHRSSAYRPQTNGAVEAANKNIKRILRRMVETSRDWSEKLPFALWAYRTSFRTSTGATPYSLVYGMEAMLPVEIEMGSLRVALEQQIPEADWAQARFDQLNLLDERRLRAADHVRAYQRKMARAFKKRVRPRPLRIGDLVLKVIRGLIRDPRGKFRPNWSGPYFIRELTPEGAAWLMDLDGNRFSEPTNVDQLKSDPSRFDTSHHHYTYHYSSFCFICLLIDIIFTLGILSFLSFLSPYHLGLRYVPCLKTTLRPWDQMSSSQPLLGQLCSDYQDRSWILTDLRSSLTGCSSRRGHDRYLTEPLRSTQPGPHFSTLGCHHASPSGRSLWIFAEVTCSRIDDSMLSDLRPIIHFDAIQGHISIRMRFTDHEGVACLSLFGEMYAEMMIYCYPHDDSLVEPIESHLASRSSWTELCRVPGPHVTISGIFPSFSHGDDRSLADPVIAFVTQPRDIVFASLTIIPELFIEISSQWSVDRDS
ncbi:Gag-Pol polyprotein [Vitis vinifera]|uniref:Gag-Pol polyprotein n=1 Tax=Vitis vinifera TaxID=29760 RepID=A0A438BM35_VITVI|nr:Gag-Pol polyprotein [Vitis vinifera]